MNSIDVAQVQYEAGFRGGQIVMAVAIIAAETAGSYDPNIVAVNEGGTKPGSRDRGLWAINDQWHPDVSDEEAFDPAFAAAWAFKNSSGGTKWTLWNAYNNKIHQKYLREAGVAHEAAKRLRGVGGKLATAMDDASNLAAELGDRDRELKAAYTEVARLNRQSERLTMVEARFRRFSDDILGVNGGP